MKFPKFSVLLVLSILATAKIAMADTPPIIVSGENVIDSLKQVTALIHQQAIAANPENKMKLPLDSLKLSPDKLKFKPIDNNKLDYSATKNQPGKLEITISPRRTVGNIYDGKKLIGIIVDEGQADKHDLKVCLPVIMRGNQIGTSETCAPLASKPN